MLVGYESQQKVGVGMAMAKSNQLAPSLVLGGCYLHGTVYVYIHMHTLLLPNAESGISCLV